MSKTSIWLIDIGIAIFIWLFGFAIGHYLI